MQKEKAMQREAGKVHKCNDAEKAKYRKRQTQTETEIEVDKNRIE
jgi:hypothetical protein